MTKITKDKILSIGLRRQAVFGFVWALAHFVDEFRQPLPYVQDPLGGVLHTVVFATAVSLLFKPSSSARLVLMSGVSVIVGIIQMPITPNHNMIFFMVDMAIVLAIGLEAFSRSPGGKPWFIVAEPFLRIALLVTYGSAVIAKMNSGWTDLSVSCSTTMPAKEFAWLPFDIPWESMWIMPVAVAGVELLVWLLPLFRPIRPYALVLAVVFHASLSLTPVSQGLGFSFLLFALLTLYLPDEAQTAIYAKSRQVVATIKERKLLATVVYSVVTFAIFIAINSFLITGSPVLGFFRYIPSLLLLFVFGGVIAIYALRYRKSEQVRPAVAIRHWTQLVLLIIILLNSLGPYLGFKTYATMTMYSNLVVEEQSSNHLFIPSIPVSNLAYDTVEIIDSSNRKLKAYSQLGYKVTWHELRRELADDPSASISYVRDGQFVELEQAYLDPELSSTDPILHKLLGFRPVSSAAACLW